SFVRIAELLGSPALPMATRLGDLWVTVPECRASPIQLQRALPVMPVDCPSTNSQFPTPKPNSAVIWDIPEHVLDNDKKISAMLANYPPLEGWQIFSRPSNMMGAKIAGALEVTWPPLQPAVPLADRIGTFYRSGLGSFAFPCLAGNVQSLHPLVSWWAI